MRHLLLISLLISSWSCIDTNPLPEGGPGQDDTQADSPEHPTEADVSSANDGNSGSPENDAQSDVEPAPDVVTEGVQIFAGADAQSSMVLLAVPEGLEAGGTAKVVASDDSDIAEGPISQSGSTVLSFDSPDDRFFALVFSEAADDNFTIAMPPTHTIADTSSVVLEYGVMLQVETENFLLTYDPGVLPAGHKLVVANPGLQSIHVTEVFDDQATQLNILGNEADQVAIWLVPDNGLNPAWGRLNWLTLP